MRARWRGRRRRGESGSVSLELVLVVPVLVLMAVFVLWAGRGGRAGLLVDLAAEEAATAAALCCEDDTAGAADREALVRDIIEARPGLDYLCVDGLRPDAPPDSGTGPEEFLSEHWLDFDPGSGAYAGGVGVLGVQFRCETDGAVAPLRGVFPTVTFQGRASEIVLRGPPPPEIGFAQTRFAATEDSGSLVFEVASGTPVFQDVTMAYAVDAGSTAAALDDYLPLSGSVVIRAGDSRAEFGVGLVDDAWFEGTEYLVLVLDPDSLAPPGAAQFDDARLKAIGVIEDDDPEPHLFVSGVADPCEVAEGDGAVFEVRLRDRYNNGPAPGADAVEVDVFAEDGTAEADGDYRPLSQRVTLGPGDVAARVIVRTVDDDVHEPDETFRVGLAAVSAVPLGAAEALCTILDDEVRVSIGDASAPEDDGTLTFKVTVDRPPAADIALEYELEDADAGLVPHRAQKGVAPCAEGDDYLGLASPPGTLTIPAGSPPSPGSIDLPVTVCPDLEAEPDERFWLAAGVLGGGAVMEPDGGAMGTIEDDDTASFCIDVDDAGSDPPTIVVHDERDLEDSMRVVGWVTLSLPLCDAFSLRVRVVEGTTGSPATGDDFTTSPFDRAWGGREHPAAVSERAVFAVDHPSTDGMFGPRGDSLVEDDEYFHLEMNWGEDMPAHYQGLEWARGTITIIDDDAPA